MAEATIRLPDGTNIQISGTPEEIARVMELYGARTVPPKSRKPSSRSKKKPMIGKRSDKSAPVDSEDCVDHVAIVNSIKDADDFDVIEQRILDKSSQLDRTLLPLWAAHEHIAERPELTSGDIAKILDNLGTPVKVSNISNTLTGNASRYVIADGVRRKGKTIRYKIHRRGIQYMRTILTGGTEVDQGSGQ